MALTCITSSGGKNGRTPGEGKIFHTISSFLKEPLAPLADNLSGERNPAGNLVVAQTVRRKQDRLGSHDHIIRRRIFTGNIFEGVVFAPGQNEGEWAMSWHGI